MLKVFVGLSGGVDSSVTAALLKEQGYDVTGVYMKNWSKDLPGFTCPWKEDYQDAKRVAVQLGIDFKMYDFEKEYRDKVVDYMVQGYQAGYTPNPDIMCNQEVKFRLFLDAALERGADMIATGHYAVVQEGLTPPLDSEVNSESSPHPLKLARSARLLRAKDSNKDQTYFLYRVTGEALAKTLFPLGEIPKTEVRKIAEQIGLPNAKKKDSTGICFIGERPFREFLNRYLSYKPGPMKTPDGTTVGQHVGLSFYTLGQRKGIGLGGMKSYQNAEGNADAWYVARKDVGNNTLYVVQGHDHPWLLSDSLVAGQTSWIAGEAPAPGSLFAKTRYRQADVSCEISASGGEFTLRFDHPQWAVTPGQSAVLYQGEVCLGGGIIASHAMHGLKSTVAPE